MMVVRGLPPNEGAQGRGGDANCADEQGIGRKVQWELMENSLTTIGPHYMETKEPTTALTDW